MEGTDSKQPTTQATSYEQIHQLVAGEFTVEEGFIEFNTPTFYVTQQANLKQAFVRLYEKLNSMQLIPVLRKRENRVMLQVVPKPHVKPSRPAINIALLIATIATTLVTGYLLSGTLLDAILFSAALMSILGAHEMAHKLTADRHKVEATYPYFIPGVPPLPTFGAVIQQKSLPPNRDALFDLGLSGPVIGFAIAVVVSLIGIPMSNVAIVRELPIGTFQPPLLFEFLANMLLKFPSTVPSGQFLLIELHPLAFAGYIGMVVTMLNLLPIGQLDGGHVAYVLVGEKSRTAVSFIALVALLFISWPMAFIAFLILRVRHPPPLDDVSRLSSSRKIATLALVLIFILTVAVIAPITELL